MPKRPLRPCVASGCPELVESGRCRQHLSEANRRRGSASSREYGAAHRAWRKKVLKLHPVCACGSLSVVADHRIPKRMFPPHMKRQAWAVSNGQGMCFSCHGKKSRGERR